MRYSIKWPQYAKQWDAMVIKQDRAAEFHRLAQFAVDHKARYQDIESRTKGIPWWLIAVLHRRESDANFNTYLGNGDPLSVPTRHVPKGRGPFHSFEDGAVDALHLDHLDRVQDWRLEKALYYCELFNGGGYDAHGLPSPYVWGGTNQQKAGKYTSDGHFNGVAWDKQPGCAPIIKAMMELDQTIQPVRET